MNKEKAFTLIELSIVIIILGLIMAGIVAGNSLIDSAKERSIYTI
ncbi:MAG: type II secretion system protein [Alphaproteobacteria bacterium]